MHRALILIVDPRVETRHWLWRSLSRSFGVVEAYDAESARRWIAERADLDALVIEDELPDERGAEVVRDLAAHAHPMADRAIVVASEWRRVMLGGLHVVEHGDIDGIVGALTGWFSTGERGQA